MTPDLSVLGWVGTLVAGGAVVLALSVGGLLAVRRTGNPTANASLGSFLIVFALVVVYVLLIGIQPAGEYLWVVFAPLPYTLSLGPLLWTYVRARMGLGRPHWVHAILPVAQACVVLSVGLAPTAAKSWWVLHVVVPWWGATETVLALVSLTGYLLSSWRTLRRLSQCDVHDWAKRRSQWIRRLLAGVTTALVVYALVRAGDLLAAAPIGSGRVWWSVAGEAIVYVAVLYGAGFAGLVHAGIRLGGVPEASSTSRPRTLSEPEAILHRQALSRLIETESPHLDPGLSLRTLAAQVGVTDKTLSVLLNESMGTTYTDYVNGLRVEEAKRRLRDPAHDHLSVLAVGLDAGFASKSTFNRVFKEHTGVTPSAFRSAGA